MLGLLAWGRRHCYKSRWHIQPEHQLPFQNQHRKIKLPAFSNVYLPAFIPVRHFILHISVNDNYVMCGCAIPIGKYYKTTSHNTTATCLSGPRVGQHKPVVFLTGGGRGNEAVYNACENFTVKQKLLEVHMVGVL